MSIKAASAWGVALMVLVPLIVLAVLAAGQAEPAASWAAPQEVRSTSAVECLDQVALNGLGSTQGVMISSRSLTIALIAFCAGGFLNIDGMPSLLILLL
jgi:hypothetical protein